MVTRQFLNFFKFSFLIMVLFFSIPKAFSQVYYFDQKQAKIRAKKSSTPPTVEAIQALITQTKSYYKKHLPYNFVYGRFNEGGVDFEAKTSFIVFNTVIVMNSNIIADVEMLNNAIKKTKGGKEAGLDGSAIFPKASFTLDVSLVNGSMQKLSSGEFHYTRSIKKPGLGKIWVNSMSLPVSVNADKSGLFLKVNSIKNFKKSAKISVMSKFEHLFLVKSGIDTVPTGAADLDEVILKGNPYYDDIRKYLDYPTLFDLKDSVHKLTKVADISITDEDLEKLKKRYGDNFNEEFVHLKKNDGPITRLKSEFNPFEHCGFTYKFMEGSRCHFVYITEDGARIFSQFLRGETRDYLTHAVLKNDAYDEIYNIMHEFNKATHKLDYNKLQQHTDPLYADYYNLYMKTEQWIAGKYPAIIPVYFAEGRAPKK